MLLININGPIHAGKSTVGRLVAMRLGARFVEVDDLLSDEEQAALNFDFYGGIFLRLDRLQDLLVALVDRPTGEDVVFAYPLSSETHARWKSLERPGVRLVAITLSPSLEVCLSDRGGGRVLEDRERRRIREMYAQGMHCPPEADAVIATDGMDVEAVVACVLGHLRAFSS